MLITTYEFAIAIFSSSLSKVGHRSFCRRR